MQTTLKVPTISCAHCKSTIEGAVGQLRGVAEVAVDITEQTVAIDFDPEVISLNVIKGAMHEVGYEVVS